MQGYSVVTSPCFLSDFERQESAVLRGTEPPEPAELFLETGLALAVPLALALATNLWLAGSLFGN